MKELAHPSTSDVFSKKIRIFQQEEIDQLKKVKEIGRGAFDEIIKVTRKQVMAMFIINFSILIIVLFYKIHLKNDMRYHYS